MAGNIAIFQLKRYHFKAKKNWKILHRQVNKQELK